MPIKHDQDLLRAVGKRLQHVRKSRGITQQQLAEHLGVEVATLSRYEIGDRAVHLSMLAKALDVLGVGLADFFANLDAAGPETGEDAELLAVWRLLDRHHRSLAIRLVREMSRPDKP